MILTALVAVFVLAGLLFMRTAVRRMRHRRYAACTTHGLSSAVFFLAAACVGLLGFDLVTYSRLTHEQPALEARFTRVGPQQFDALLTYPSGESKLFSLQGDEWQVDARILKWRAIGNVLGFDTAYRLERIGGRFSDVDRERAGPRTVYALHPPPRVDAWTLFRGYHEYIPWVDALYGSATYLPMTDGALYRVNVSQDGLIARPLNQEARQAVGVWR